MFSHPSLSEFDRTENSAIRYADPENPSLEPIMKWIGRTVCEIFAFKLYCDLKTRVRGHSKSSNVAQFDRAYTTLYSSSIVNIPPSITVSEILVYWSKIATPLYLAPPARFTQQPFIGDKKTRMTVLSNSEYVNFWYNTRVTRRTDRRMDHGRTDRRIRAMALCCRALKRGSWYVNVWWTVSDNLGPMTIFNSPEMVAMKKNTIVTNS